MDEVAVLERTREERPRRGELLETLPVVPEPDDERTRLDPAHGLEQQVDALVVEELAEVEDGRPLVLEEAGQPVGVALVGQPLVGVARVGRIEPALLEKVGQRLGASLGPKLFDVDSRRDLMDALDLPRHLVNRYVDITRGAIFYLDPHICIRCRYRSTELLWQCPHCHEWNTFVEERIAPAKESEV